MKNIILVICLSLCLATHSDDLSAKQGRDDTSQYIMPVANALPNTDTNNLDNDSRTDSFLLAAWLGISGNWPNLSLPSVLVELTFNIVSASTDTSPINITSTSNAAGFAFDGQRNLIAVDGTSSIIIPSQTTGTQQAYISSYLKSSDGKKALVKISYNSDDPTTTGLGLRIHYDNRVLQLSDVNNVLETGLFIRPEATSGPVGNGQPAMNENVIGLAMPEGFTPPSKDAAVTDAIVNYYNPSTGETWQSSTGGYGLAPGWIRGTKEDYERNKEYFDSLIQGAEI